MKLQVNGAPYDWPGGSLVALLRSEGFDPDKRGLAVAVNGAVVARRLWSETDVREGDKVEIVRAVAGG